MPQTLFPSLLEISPLFRGSKKTGKSNHVMLMILAAFVKEPMQHGHRLSPIAGFSFKHAFLSTVITLTASGKSNAGDPPRVNSAVWVSEKKTRFRNYSFTRSEEHTS